MSMIEEVAEGQHSDSSCFLYVYSVFHRHVMYSRFPFEHVNVISVIIPVGCGQWCHTFCHKSPPWHMLLFQGHDGFQQSLYGGRI
jgi:hypothetical protein